MDKALKQRLVGASVLIILAVIVLPMLLSGRSDTLKQESRQIELPPQPDELSIETRRFPVGLPNKPAPATGAETGEDVAEVVEQQVKVEETNIEEKPGAAGEIENADNQNSTPAQTRLIPPAVTSITLKSGRAEDVNKTLAADGSQDTPRYLVQVASFSSEKRANTLAGQLRADNFQVLMDVVDRAAGRLHRVRVGPYAERSDADVIVASIRSKIKDVSPRVLDLKPAESSPVSTPSDPLVRWVVQVGSFSNAKAAQALVAELRLAGLTAFSEKVSSANGIAHKVRIGPELNRDRATELARKVKAEHNLDAFVTTQE